MNEKLQILKYYMWYKNKSYKSRERLEKFQKKKLKKHLAFVTEKSEFYKKYEDKDISEFPIIDKKIMMDNFDKLNTVGIKKQEALDFAINSEKTREFGEKLKGITIGLSSGTSNARGVFLVADEEKVKWAGYILARYLKGELLKGRRVAFFMRADSNLYETLNSKQVKFEFFDIFKSIESNLKRLNQFNPDILVGQPSVLIEIAKNIENKKIYINPKKIISIAEVLEKNDENYIKKIFKKDVIYQVYQCTEGCLATTCEYGNIHLNEDIVFFEKEYIDEKRFIPIITDFTRTSQPIIRYRLNDILVEKKEKCKCGSTFTIIEKIEGREDDIFIFDSIIDNNKIKVFPDFIRRCILFAGDINEYRCVQKESGDICIYTNDVEKKEDILKQFKKLAEDMKFKLPIIEFKNYNYDNKKKLKRVESMKK